MNTVTDTDYLPAARRYDVHCPHPACDGKPRVGRVWHRDTDGNLLLVARSAELPDTTSHRDSARLAAEWVLAQHDIVHHGDALADPEHLELRRAAAIDLSLSTL